jgi:hypothetical protein
MARRREDAKVFKASIAPSRIRAFVIVAAR